MSGWVVVEGSAPPPKQAGDKRNKLRYNGVVGNETRGDPKGTNSESPPPKAAGRPPSAPVKGAAKAGASDTARRERSLRGVVYRPPTPTAAPAIRVGWVGL
jgi:hypothetical protein